MSDHLLLDITAPAVGGDCLARDETGRVVLVAGAVPGDRVAVEITEEHPRYARGTVTRVLIAGPGRVTPPCPEVARGCGGCDLQHLHHDRQRRLKQQVVEDALRRVGRFDADVLAALPIEPGADLPAVGYRTTVRAAVDEAGRAGYRRRRSHEALAVDGCLVAHPLVEEVLVAGRFPGATEVMIRVGARTGERMCVVTPTAAGATVPEGVLLVGADEVASGHPATITEEIGGVRFRVSARSFLQARPDGAEALVDAVRRAGGDALEAARSGRFGVVDLYGGIGLFPGVLGLRGATLVEGSAAAVADARVNLDHLDVTAIRCSVERWRPSPAGLVIADPPRAGLGKAGVAKVVATGAEQVVLVACDPASLARDLRLLVDSGYVVEGLELVDLFPGTHHVECVAGLRRSGGHRADEGPDAP